MAAADRNRWRALAGALCVLCCGVAATNAQRVERVLAQTPLIDGHNDLPWQIRERFNGDLSKVDLGAATAGLPAPPGEPALMTDIPRPRAARPPSAATLAGLDGPAPVRR